MTTPLELASDRKPAPDSVMTGPKTAGHDLSQLLRYALIFPNDHSVEPINLTISRQGIFCQAAEFPDFSLTVLGMHSG